MRRLYIHEQPDWPRLDWKAEAVADALADVRHRQGRLLGRMETLGFGLRREAVLGTLVEDVVKSSDIEGEKLDAAEVRSSIEAAGTALAAVLAKARFRERASGLALSERQRRVLNRVLDGFAGKLTTSKWAKLAKCSPDTALRDITILVGYGLLARNPGGGRNTSYRLVTDSRRAGD